MLGTANSVQTAGDLPVAERLIPRMKAVVLWRLGVATAAAIAVLACSIAVLAGFGAARNYGPGVAQSRMSGEKEQASYAQFQRLAAARAAKRQRWLESPGARAQRAESQMEFHGLAGDAAQRLLVRDYGSFLAGVSATPAASIAQMGSVVHYLSDYRAVVRTPHGLLIETSTVPLIVVDGAGKKRPVDLRLRARGDGFAPVTTPDSK